ncbi:hypothetical protein CC2G_000219 [Coprinopsis cinerea AmutBmut pab1-1]|nr:hypothetical protein CC2G_000219 [Coprinopsis cinerea AmutBmut pab1-1]
MNLSYDSEQAKKKLSELYSGNSADEQQAGPVTPLTDFKAKDFDVVFFQQPDAYRVVRKDSNEWIEPNFSIIGILCGKSLPPVVSPRTRTAKVIRALRQHVRLTGLGCSEFDTVQAAFEDVFKLFADQDHLRTTLQPLTFEPYEGYPALDAHARYFTDRKASPMEKSLPFPLAVDPVGTLESLRGEMFIHGTDNQVEYARKVANGTGGFRLEAFDPSQFRAGDIVQVTTTAYHRETDLEINRK